MFWLIKFKNIFIFLHRKTDKFKENRDDVEEVMILNNFFFDELDDFIIYKTD